MIELFYEMLHQKFNITEEEFLPLKKILKTKTYDKGTYLLQEGEVDLKIKFVAKGIVHQYVLLDGNIHTVDIKISGMTFNSLKSYVEESPSIEIQQAVTETTIVYFAKADFEKLLQTMLFCTIYLRSIEQIFIHRETRTLLLQHKSASERFRIFMNTDQNANQLLSEVPQKLLANYLAMAPETFSKVKKHYFLNFD